MVAKNDQIITRELKAFQDRFNTSCDRMQADLEAMRNTVAEMRNIIRAHTGVEPITPAPTRTLTRAEKRYGLAKK